ncbi:SDR family oxidoreductase [Catelliglobosispora koreensis]|uniref:SDR family oxidoreductase n=1 Tax=Catelliglobosispora koreensis TaxID=129052 RepID=UPI0003671743|nr:NAD(P)H-binding protein [Catelliglobosispora koreensis]
MSENILVTGATGNVGRHLVEQLLADGHRVRALTRHPDQAGLPEGTDLIKGNLADTATLAEAFDGVTAVHLITFDGVDFSPLANGAEIAPLAQGKRVSVLAGDVNKSPLEDALDAAGVGYARLAPVEFMSNALEWAESIKTEGVVREGFPDMKSAMIHDADIAAVAATALTTEGHAGRDYWLTGPQALTPPEKVRTISEVLGRDIKFIELTQDEIVAVWRESGFSEEDVEFFLMMRTNPPEAGYTVLPTVEQVTGKPARPFAQWVAENAKAFS